MKCSGTCLALADLRSAGGSAGATAGDSMGVAGGGSTGSAASDALMKGVDCSSSSLGTELSKEC